MIYLNARAIIERCNGNNTEIVLQTRIKPGDSGRLELPGGQVNQFESLIDTVKREVFEETGLKVVEIEGQNTRIESKIDGGFSMECLKPFAVYQSLTGPVDSMGVYFKCKAIGTLKAEGDCTLDAKWIDVNQLQVMIDNKRELFSEIDVAGILFYLQEKVQ